MRQDRSGGLFLAAGFVLAGTATTAGKGLASALGPFTITAAGLAFALPALLPFALRGPRPSGKELGATALLGFFGIFVYRACLVSALSRVGAGEAGLMTGAAPAFTAIASWLLLGEAPSLFSVSGVALSSAGVFLVRYGAAGAEAAAAAERSLGLLLALGAAASEAAFAVLSRRTRNVGFGGDQRRRTALTAAWAFAFSLGPALGERPAEALAALPFSGWAALAWYGLFVTAASYVCWYEGIRRTEASRAAAYTGIVPVVAFFLPAALLGEQLTPASVAGCALVALGIAATSGERPSGRTALRGPK
jgi:drug/metabolite transporter (DMT)-like permease